MGGGQKLAKYSQSIVYCFALLYNIFISFTYKFDIPCNHLSKATEFKCQKSVVIVLSDPTKGIGALIQGSDQFQWSVEKVGQWPKFENEYVLSIFINLLWNEKKDSQQLKIHKMMIPRVSNCWWLILLSKGTTFQSGPQFL